MTYDYGNRGSVPSAEYLAEDVGWRLLATSIACIAIATLFAGLRFWSRCIQRTQARVDDVLIILSWFMIAGLCTAVILDVKLGDAGRHREFVFAHFSHFVAWLKITLIAVPTLYVLSITLPKLALLWMFLTLFTGKKSRWVCFVLAGFTIITALVEIPFVIFQCNPQDLLWRQYTSPNAGGSCYNPIDIFRWGMIPFLVTDVLMLILPGPIIWRLQISLKVRVSIIATLCLKTIGVSCSSVRLPALFANIEDTTWDTVWFLIWTVLEPTCYFVAVCVVSSRPLIRHFAYDSRISPFIQRALRPIGIRVGDTPAPPLPIRPDPEQAFSSTLWLQPEETGTITTISSAGSEKGDLFPPFEFLRAPTPPQQRCVLPPVYTPGSRITWDYTRFV